LAVIRVFNTYEPVSSIIRDLAPALGEAGVETELVISKTEYRRGRAGLDECVALAGGRVVRIPSGIGRAGSGIAKIAVIVTYALGAAVYSLFARQAAVNVFLTQPPLFFVWARLLRAIRRQPYVIVLMDMYPDAAIAHGTVARGGIIEKLAGWLAGVGLRSAQRVIVIGRCMQDRVLRYGVREESVQCIPNWADEKAIFPVARSDNTIAEELGLGSQFVVLYSGNMGVGHRFEDLLEVARRLRDEESIRFVFVGGGARRGEIERYQEEHDLKNVVLRDFVPAERMAEGQSLGDIHFVSLREEFEGIMVPSKVYGALAAGRPIIYHGGADSEVARMVLEEDVGAVIGDGEVDRLEQVLVAYASDRDIARQAGERALDLAHGKYSKDSAIATYVDTLTACVRE
jgi:glycosyltransferase involved in cell wall biosynthesis